MGLFEMTTGRPRACKYSMEYWSYPSLAMRCNRSPSISVMSVVNCLGSSLTENNSYITMGMYHTYFGSVGRCKRGGIGSVNVWVRYKTYGPPRLHRIHHCPGKIVTYIQSFGIAGLTQHTQPHPDKHTSQGFHHSAGYSHIIDTLDHLASW